MVEEHLEDRLDQIAEERPARQPLPHPGPCEWVDVPLTKRFWRGKGVYMTFRRECRKCKRFYGYGWDAGTTDQTR